MYKLYGCPGSASFAPQAVLEETGLPYAIERVDIHDGSTRKPDFLAVNPAGYVPALATETGELLTESAAIMTALCDRHSLGELIPAAGGPARGIFYRWLFYMTNTIQPVYQCYYYADRYSTEPAHFPAIKEKAQANLIERWKVSDDHLAATGPYHLGARYSACDIYMTMLVTWFDPCEALLGRYPALQRCFELTTARPAVARTLAAHGSH